VGKFKIPRSLLHQLNECSSGGFLLFNFDEDGTPQVYMIADSDMHSLALVSHAEGYVDAAKSNHVQLASDSLKSSLEENEEEFPEDDWLDDLDE
tara:strand:+ start:93 stop:374 length:282 start_codon:yes stop_codon:yes gene_type:complete